MKNAVCRFLYWLLQLTWGILQNLLGLFLWLILTVLKPCRKRFVYHGAFVSQWRLKFSMGLGLFIFYGHEGAPDAAEVLVHEYGHTIQSVILGPLFVLVIGIPSLCWAFLPCFVRMRKKRNIYYLDAYCESWANRLGEAVTGLPAPERESRT